MKTSPRKNITNYAYVLEVDGQVVGVYGSFVKAFYAATKGGGDGMRAAQDVCRHKGFYFVLGEFGITRYSIK